MSDPARKFKYEDSYNSYINGSSAVRKARESAAPKRSPVRQTRQAPAEPIRRNVPRPVQSPAYQIDIQRSRKSSLLRLAAFVVVFAGAFLCVFTMAYTASRKMDYSGLQKELKQLKIDNIVLKGEILDSYDLTEVNRYVREVLGMVDPDESQIVYVDEVKVSYVERYDVEETEINPFGLIKDMFASVAGLIKADK